MAAPQQRPSSPIAVVVLALVAGLAWLARELDDQRVSAAPGSAAGEWFSVDPDGLYHARRLERALDEGRVAADDPLLDHPHGSPIPWPPYYTQVLRLVLGPLAPSAGDMARHAWIERAVAELPRVWACLTACVAALAAWRFGGALAGGVAGATFALLGASLDYSAPGIGDHHAFATLLAALAFALVAAAFDGAVRRTPRGAALLGAAAGACAGLLLGSWVGGLVQIALIQLALGLLVCAHARRPVDGLVPFGLAFHLALAAAVLPAVLASPWRAAHPWMTINLSWLHLALPLAGALVFAPPAFLPPGSRGARRYPWIAAAAIAAAGALACLGDTALARGLREGWSWASRNHEFMAYINESQPLLWGQVGGPAELQQQLGLAAWLALPAWILAARRALAGERGLLVWAVALPPMLLQALVQRRFAEACGVPLAVALGVAAGALAARSLPRLAAHAPRAAAAGLVLGALGQWPALAGIVERTRAGQTVAGGPLIADQRAYREVLEWLGERTPAGSGVLAAWDLGHAIEWVAGRPTVATNFGSYVGEEGYLAPWRFFLEEDPRAAEALLAQRDARYVLLLGNASKDLEVMLRLLRPGERRQFVELVDGAPRPAPRWYRTMAARLMLTGKVGDPSAGQLTGDSLDFLRLVHVSPAVQRMPPPIPHTGGEIPAGWVWERVPGAVVAARAAGGEELEVSFDVEYPPAGRRLRWSATAAAGADGRARVRVPYATDAPNGDGAVLAPRWRVGGRGGALSIPERAVLQGGEVALP